MDSFSVLVMILVVRAVMLVARGWLQLGMCWKVPPYRPFSKRFACSVEVAGSVDVNLSCYDPWSERRRPFECMVCITDTHLVDSGAGMLPLTWNLSRRLVSSSCMSYEI